MSDDVLTPVENIRERLQSVLRSIDSTLYQHSALEHGGLASRRAAPVTSEREHYPTETTTLSVPPPLPPRVERREEVWKEKETTVPTAIRKEDAPPGRASPPPPVAPAEVVPLAEEPSRVPAFSSTVPSVSRLRAAPTPDTTVDNAAVVRTDEPGSSFLNKYCNDSSLSKGPTLFSSTYRPGQSTSINRGNSSKLFMETVERQSVTDVVSSQTASVRSSIDGVSPVREYTSYPQEGPRGNGRSALEDTAEIEKAYTTLHRYVDPTPAPAPPPQRQLPEPHEVNTPRRNPPLRPRETPQWPTAEPGKDLLVILKQKRDQDLSALYNSRHSLPPAPSREATVVDSTVGSPPPTHVSLLHQRLTEQEKSTLHGRTDMPGEAERAVRRRLQEQRLRHSDQETTRSQSPHSSIMESYKQKQKAVAEREAEHLEKLMQRSEAYLLESLYDHEKTKMFAKATRQKEERPTSAATHAIRRYAEQLKRLKAFYEGHGTLFDEDEPEEELEDEREDVPSRRDSTSSERRSSTPEERTERRESTASVVEEKKLKPNTSRFEVASDRPNTDKGVRSGNARFAVAGSSAGPRRHNSESSVEEDEHTQLPQAVDRPQRTAPPQTKAEATSPPPRSDSLATTVSNERLHVSPKRSMKGLLSSSESERDEDLSSVDIPVDVPSEIAVRKSLPIPTRDKSSTRRSSPPARVASPSPSYHKGPLVSEDLVKKHTALSAALAEMTMMQAAVKLKDDGIPLHIKQLGSQVPAKAFLTKDESELLIIVEKMSQTTEKEGKTAPKAVPAKKAPPKMVPKSPGSTFMKKVPPPGMIPMKRPPSPGTIPFNPYTGNVQRLPPGTIPIQAGNGQLRFLNSSDPRIIHPSMHGAMMSAYGPPSVSRTNSGISSKASTRRPPPSPTPSSTASESSVAAPEEKVVRNVLIREKHHFPLRNARIVLPFGVIGNEADLGEGGPRTWEDVSGVWCGPAACELLRRYHCTIFSDVRAPVYHPYRVYLLVPDTQRGELPKEAILLVIDFDTRLDWMTFVLGVQSAKGGPPLSYGRLLWLLATQRLQRARSLVGINPFDMDCIWRGVAPPVQRSASPAVSSLLYKQSAVAFRVEEETLPRLRRRGRSSSRDPSPSTDHSKLADDRVGCTKRRWLPFGRSKHREKATEESPHVVLRDTPRPSEDDEPVTRDANDSSQLGYKEPSRRRRAPSVAAMKGKVMKLFQRKKTEEE
ncbi:hypothetical protein ADEAN_000979000 [Angomonas deanei]|uniref:Uncharacterized protein n=1 Tax=Angomonas deanei TaxID=59799 RepID=A0A7G2CR65_9TRYP|nr:hypothetical protein ADEAN_000979000 [Angomonas deanei]